MNHGKAWDRPWDSRMACRQRSGGPWAWFGIFGLLTASILAGCQQAADDRPTVALIMKSLANEFFKTMEDGAIAHQRAHAAEYNLLANGIKDELDVAKQVELVEQMIAQQVDAIVIAPADSKALIPVCKRATEAGIAVINIDNKFDAQVLEENQVHFPFVGPDNRKGARLAGEYLAKQLAQGDEVAILEGMPNAFNGIERKLGFEDAMKSSGMNIVSSQSAYWETDKANTIASAILNEHQNIQAILCANDSMALGAVAAVKAAGKTGQVRVIGFDNNRAVQQLMRDGKIVCTVDQHADQIAVEGINYALQYLKEKGTLEDKETRVDLITPDSIR